MVRKKRAKLPALTTLEQWCEAFSAQVAIDVYYIFEAEKDKVGPENHRHLIATFLAGLISAVVYKYLAEAPAELKTQEEKYNYAMDSFGDIKARIQEAVAAGFSGGMKSWCGQQVDYYCQVKVTPEPVNKGNPC